MFLLDTNIWLERLLGQEQSKIVGQLLDNLEPSEIVMTDFSLHSIGVICNRLKQRDVFLNFVEDVLIDNSVKIVNIPPKQMKRLVEIMNRFNLDFDDAYQYVAAEIEKAEIVSFDKDFDKTDQGRLTPMQVIQLKS
jgi:predicted nucleic acid-binding protein